MAAYASLAILLIAAAALLATAAAYLMARGLVRPPRMNDGKALWVLRRLTPRDLDLPYENATFDVRDEATGRPVRLAAWWIPAATPDGRKSDRTVVLIHGYADAKVGALAWAPAWHDLRFNILAVDLRAHGDSGGDLCSGGYWERHDVAAVVREWAASRPDVMRTVILFGASLGAAVAVGAAELLGPTLGVAASGGRRDSVEPSLVHGVVLESPFADFESASDAHLDRAGMPGGVVRRAAMAWARRMTKARFADGRPIDLIPRVHCPVLVLAAGDDVYVSEAEADAIKRAVEARPSAGADRYVRFDGVGHLMAVVDAPVAYRVAIETFVRSVGA